MHVNCKCKSKIADKEKKPLVLFIAQNMAEFQFDLLKDTLPLNKLLGYLLRL